jgi:hypothetical protein
MAKWQCRTPPSLAPCSCLFGAFALHTRSYQAKTRPLKAESHFSVLFQRVAGLALARFGGSYEQSKQNAGHIQTINPGGRGGGSIDEGGGSVTDPRLAPPHSLTPKGYRTQAEEVHYQLLRARSVNARDQVPDPPFVPIGPLFRVIVTVPPAGEEHDLNESIGGEGEWEGQSITFVTQGGRTPYELPKMMPKSAIVARKDERAVWLWHPSAAAAPTDSLVGGFIRPSYTRTSNNYCLALAQNAPAPDIAMVGLRMVTCDPIKPEQRWVVYNASEKPGSLRVVIRNGPDGRYVVLF